jgi:YVTN family beta-propeller protein
MKPSIFSIVLFLSIAGCVADDPIIPPTGNPVATKGIFVLNEGGFTKSNASLSLFVPDSQKVYDDIFFAANNRPLGDVANDIVIHENKAYIVVNNSHKIEVLSTETHASLGTMQVPGNSPNKIAIVSAAKGYITNLYKGTVTVFNPTTLTIIRADIGVGQNPQGLIAANGKIYVCNSGYGSDSTVTVIDIGKDSVMKTITVGHGPTDIGIDADGDLFVRCTGYMDWSNPGKDTPGRIVVIDPKTDSVVSAIPMSLENYGHLSSMAVTKKGIGFVVVKNGIAKFETASNSIIEPRFSSIAGYAISYDESEEKLYVTDAKDFVRNGMIYGIDNNGVTRDSAIVGIIPGTIAFKR